MAQGLTVATLLVLKRYMQIMQMKTSTEPPITPTNSRVCFKFDFPEELSEGEEDDVLVREGPEEETDGSEEFGLGVGTGVVVERVWNSGDGDGDGKGEDEGEGEGEEGGMRTLRSSAVDSSLWWTTSSVWSVFLKKKKRDCHAADQTNNEVSKESKRKEKKHTRDFCNDIPCTGSSMQGWNFCNIR